MPKPKSLRSLTLNQSMTGMTNGPPSPTLSEATQASQMQFGANGPEKIITRADLKGSLQAHENLITASAAYRDALLHMSRASAGLADAMTECACLKGTSYLSGSRILAASGLHHLMASHWHVLCDSVEKQFEQPLRQNMDKYRATVKERSSNYEAALREKSKIIKHIEMENMNLARKKNRNLQTFREALSILQRQVEELDELRVAHYQEIMEHEEQVWDFVQGKVSLVVRSTLDVLDRFTAKASDPVIEPMLHSIPDPFDSYGPQKSEDQIFSILTPLAIFNPSASPSPQIAPAEIDPSSSFSVSPTGVYWTNDHCGNNNGAQWEDSRTPTSSPPPTSVKSGVTITEPRERERAISFPGALASKSKRSSTFPPGSPPNKSPARSPPSGKRVESKLRKSLSAISESSSSTVQTIHAEPLWSSPTPTPMSSDPINPTQPDAEIEAEAEVEAEPETDTAGELHVREGSSETIRGFITSMNDREIAADRSPENGMNGISSFTEFPIWGSQSSPTSPAFVPDHDQREIITTNTSTSTSSRDLV